MTAENQSETTSEDFDLSPTPGYKYADKRAEEVELKIGAKFTATKKCYDSTYGIEPGSVIEITGSMQDTVEFTINDKRRFWLHKNYFRNYLYTWGCFEPYRTAMELMEELREKIDKEMRERHGK